MRVYPRIVALLALSAANYLLGWTAFIVVHGDITGRTGLALIGANLLLMALLLTRPPPFKSEQQELRAFYQSVFALRAAIVLILLSALAYLTVGFAARTLEAVLAMSAVFGLISTYLLRAKVEAHTGS